MANNINHLNRRDILKGFGLGALGLTLGGKSFGPARWKILRPRPH